MEVPDNYKRNIWQWMLPELALTLLGLLIYFHHFNGSVGTLDRKNGVDLTSSRKDHSVIISYLVFFDDGPDRMALGHQYASNALLVLMEATSAAASFVEVDLKARLASMIVYAAITTNDPKQQPMQTASCGCYLLSDALLTIQSTKYPELINPAPRCVVRLRKLT
ncbi:hypothetical protein ACWKW6_33680 [Dyadobacter jiangsuensis]